MTQQFKNWRKEIEALDAEIVRLCERRVALAIELLQTLRRELSLGELSHDADRLTLLLFEHVDSAMLEPKLIIKLFGLLNNECRRAAEQSARLLESNGHSVISDAKQNKEHAGPLSEFLR